MCKEATGQGYKETLGDPSRDFSNTVCLSLLARKSLFCLSRDLRGEITTITVH